MQEQQVVQALQPELPGNSGAESMEAVTGGEYGASGVGTKMITSKAAHAVQRFMLLLTAAYCFADTKAPGTSFGRC